MPEQDKPFVVNDRRKFRMDGELRDPQTAAESPAGAEPEAATGPVPVPPPDRHEASTPGPIPINSAHLVTPVPEPADDEPSESLDEPESVEDTVDEQMQRELPPPPTPEEIEQVRLAYEATSDRLDMMMRSQNLGGEHLPPMDFTRVVQSIYMSAMVQLGAGTQQGQQPRVDLIGAKQSIDMLAIIAAKAGSNLTEEEVRLIDAALFELRMGFLEITQLLARQAAAKQAPPVGPTGGAGGFGSGAGSFTGAGPRIVR